MPASIYRALNFVLSSALAPEDILRHTQEGTGESFQQAQQDTVKAAEHQK